MRTIREAIDELNKKPCSCIVCSLCRGTGNIRVDDRSQSEGYDLETCDQCGGGVVETCERCMEMGELYEQLEQEVSP